MPFLSFPLSENFTVKARTPVKSLMTRSQQVLIKKLSKLRSCNFTFSEVLSTEESMGAGSSGDQRWNTGNRPIFHPLLMQQMASEGAARESCSL